MKQTLMGLTLLFSLGACAPAPSQPSPAASSAAVVNFNYTLQDAMYVYTCAYNKENDPAEKERLNNGLKLLRLFTGKEAEYTASVDQDRANRHRVMNDLAVKYTCYG